MNREQIESLVAKHHRCNGKTCTCTCDRKFLANGEMLIGPDPRAGVWCAHYYGEDFPGIGMKTREWYLENDPQSLVDSINKHADSWSD